MRRTWFGLWGPCLAAALALGQNGHELDRIRDRGTAGPGYIQKSFVGDLEGSLRHAVGQERTAEMLEHLRSRDLEPRRVVDLINGTLRNGDLRKLFGARRREQRDVERAIQRAIDEKNRRLFFGVLFHTMIQGKDSVEPSSPFCKQACHATRFQIEAKDFERLLKRNVSKKLIGEAFAFRNDKDRSLMQGFLNRMWDSPFVKHPMNGAMSGHRPDRKYEVARFPTLRAGMPGFGGEFADGTAGGLQFDVAMPPCAFLGTNLETYFEPD